MIDRQHAHTADLSVDFGNLACTEREHEDVGITLGEFVRAANYVRHWHLLNIVVAQGSVRQRAPGEHVEHPLARVVRRHAFAFEIGDGLNRGILRTKNSE